HDGTIARLHVPFGDVAEVLDLRRVDVGLQLPVGSDQPPPAGQLQGEVAASLPRAPAAEVAAAELRAEQSRKRGESVVPVVIPGNRKHMWRLLRVGAAERGLVGG